MPDDPFSAAAIGLVLTFRCSASCRHCLFECSPDRDETMPIEDALRYVQCMGDIPGVLSVVITGGEPFLYYKDLLVIVAAARTAGLSAKVITNAFWARGRRETQRKLEPLARAGLQAMDVSFDRFHTEYIPKRNVEFAVETALMCGLKVAVAGVTNADQVQELAETLPGEFGRAQKLDRCETEPSTARSRLSFVVGSVLPIGRGAALSLMSSGQEPVQIDLPCKMIIRGPAILPNGDVAACCGVGVGSRSGFHPRFIVGNAKQESLAQLLKRMRRDPLYQMILIHGPLSLLALGTGMDQATRGRYANLCAICSEVVTTPGLLGDLDSRLLERRTELQVELLYRKAMYLEGDEKLRTAMTRWLV